MLHFYQGKESLLKDDSEERQIATVKAKIAGFFDMKNVFPANVNFRITA